MLISIIIPTYNNEDVVLRSLETWTKQTLSKRDYEVIIVDNNSTDNSADLIKKFVENKSNFQYVLETNPGATNARHAGAKQAKSDILLFCDDDGLFNPECLEEILKVYKNNPKADAVTGKIEVLWDKEPPDWITPYLFMLGALDYGYEIAYSTEFFLNGGIFSIRKQVFEDLGGFNPDLLGGYLIGDGDTGLVIKLHKNCSIIGYTPFAVMQHIQFVGKQGNQKDMGRRFYNVGVSNAYGFFREHQFHFSFKVIKYMLNSLIFLIKKYVEYVLTNKRKLYFSMMQKKGELKFFLNLCRKDIRKVILNT